MYDIHVFFNLYLWMTAIFYIDSLPVSAFDSIVISWQTKEHNRYVTYLCFSTDHNLIRSCNWPRIFPCRGQLIVASCTLEIISLIFSNYAVKNFINIGEQMPLFPGKYLTSLRSPIDLSYLALRIKSKFYHFSSCFYHFKIASSFAPM